MTAPTDQAAPSGPAAPIPVPSPSGAVDLTDPASDPAPPDPTPPRPGGNGPAHGRGGARHGWWGYGFPIVLALLLVAAPVLIYAGARVVLASNDGRLIAGTADPTRPGWTATVPATQTMLLAGINDAGQLSTVDVLALTSPKLGNVVQIPVDTRVQAAAGAQTLGEAYASGGSSGLQTATQTLLGLAIDQIELLNSRNWQDLVTPAGSLTFDNADDVVVNGTELFAQGQITVTPAQVGSYFFSRNYSEDDANRLLRGQALWKAWLTKVAASKSPGIVPGEVDTGIGQFVRTLAHQQVQYSVLPATWHALNTSYSGVYLLVQPGADTVINAAIPFPVAFPAGSRPRIRVLDGTGQLNHGLVAAHNLAVAGAQIDSIGNAASFHDPQTELIVANPANKAEAQKLRDALGVGVVLQSNSADESVDVTVVLGADALRQRSVTDTVLAPPTSSTTLPPDVVPNGG